MGICIKRNLMGKLVLNRKDLKEKAHGLYFFIKKGLSSKNPMSFMKKPNSLRNFSHSKDLFYYIFTWVKEIIFKIHFFNAFFLDLKKKEKKKN